MSERPENFKELLPISNNLGQLMKEHSDSLRKFRNNFFHLREDTELVCDFFDKRFEHIQWALELHITLSDFFLSINLVVNCIISGMDVKESAI